MAQIALDPAAAPSTDYQILVKSNPDHATLIKYFSDNKLQTGAFPDTNATLKLVWQAGLNNGRMTTKQYSRGGGGQPPGRRGGRGGRRERGEGRLTTRGGRKNR